MSLIPTFPINSLVNNADIVNEFQCGNMGGMRRSTNTNTLVIVSDHTKGLYEDRWVGDVLHYTGMGKSGDQRIDFMQNKTLAESGTNNVEVHLFEVLEVRQYRYLGVVELCDTPYQEFQKDQDGLLRRVWMFPLKVLSGDIAIDQRILERHEERIRRNARRLSADEIGQRAIDSQSENVSVRSVNTNAYVRNVYVSEYAKIRANGVCQLCDENAPFADNEAKPYLETHHINWISRGGTDTVENTVALCPNCHRKMHVLDLEEDREKLMNAAQN